MVASSFGENSISSLENYLLDFEGNYLRDSCVAPWEDGHNNRPLSHYEARFGLVLLEIEDFSVLCHQFRADSDKPDISFGTR